MFIVKKQKNKETYYYLRKTQRINGKVIAKDIAYLGKTRKGAEKRAAEIENNLKNKENTSVVITYFVHGTTLDNEKHISSGWHDVDLSPLGIKQSEELPRQIGNKKFDAVFCSDLKRAVHSAKISFDKKYKIVQDRRLRECDYGDYNAKPSSIVEPMQEKHITKEFPNGESYEDVKKRITEFLNYLYENYKGKHIAIIAHKAPQLAIEVLLNNKTWEEAFSEDWRKVGKWQPGWDYVIKQKPEVLKDKDIKKDYNKMAVEKPKIDEKKIEKKESKTFGIEEMMMFCKRKGFVYPSGEIYGGFAGFWDFGPFGVELKNNIKQNWWSYHVRQRDDMTGIDGSIITNPEVWKASGHVASFSDIFVVCKKCKKPGKVDKTELGKVKCPNCGGDFDEKSAHEFKLMFKTDVGTDSYGYLRPETAQLMFADFKFVQQNARMQLPFGIAQVGKAFRNEIAPRDFLFRCREFEQMEIEYFVDPAEKCPYRVGESEILVYSAQMQQKNEEPKKMKFKEAYDRRIIRTEWHAYWLEQEFLWFVGLGANPNKFRIRQHLSEEKSHYALDTWDLQYEFPFGWSELQGMANRTDYDLKQHQTFSKVSMEILNKEGKKILPHVVCEPSQGVERAFLVFMFDAYNFDEKRQNIILKLHPRLAPVKAAVFPMLKEEKYEKIAEDIVKDLRQEWNIAFDTTGSIGKRYSRNDEIGTPMCITVDEETPKDKSVTIRDRDTTKQIRVKISELHEVVRKVISGENLLKLGKIVETRVKEE